MWRDRRVIVTGGTAGFGFVLARHLAAAGARVLVVGRSSEGVRMALAALEAAGPGVRGLAADLTGAGEGGRVVGECLRILGGVDDVFCCVGRSGRGRMLETSEAELRSYLEANLLAAGEDGMSPELHDSHLHRLPGAIGWLLEDHRHAVVGQRPPKCFGSLLSKGQD